MTQPTKILWAVLSAILGPLAACGEAPEVQQPQCEQGTNVVIFLIDTLRADRLGAYDYGRATSPHLDALAKESVLFERAHAPAPWTLPSVTSLMLGSLLPEHGVIKDGDRIARDAQPLAERMRKLGYSTGSFIHNPYAGAMTGLDRGFDVCEQVKRDVGKRQLKQWLNAEPSHPFFLYLHNTIPHDPYRPEPAFLKTFGQVSPRSMDHIQELQEEYRQLTRENYAPWKEKQGLDNSQEQTALIERLADYGREIDDLYDAEVMQVDQLLGELIETLKLRGEWENTVFIVLADHGEELGDHGGWEHDHSLYDELVRVPLLIRLPGAEHAGRRVGGPVSLIDVLPTILHWLGQEQDTGELGGRSLLPAMAGGEVPAGPRVLSYRLNKKKRYTPHREQRGPENLVLCEGPWKAIWNVQPDTLELYNTVLDPNEQDDRSAKQAALSARLRELAKRQHAVLLEAGLAREEEQRAAAPLSTEQRERLQALGYLGEDD